MLDIQDRPLVATTRSRIGKFFSFPTLLVAVLLASPFFSSSNVWQGAPILRDPDIWWHMRNAETLLDTHHFITTDTYSFTTRGQHWIDPEWLAEMKKNGARIDPKMHKWFPEAVYEAAE